MSTTNLLTTAIKHITTCDECKREEAPEKAAGWLRLYMPIPVKPMPKFPDDFCSHTCLVLYVTRDRG